MALSLTQALIQEKNKVESAEAWLVLIDLIDPNNGLNNLYLVRNNEDVTVNGQLYQAFPFEISDVVETSSGSLPSFSLKVSNIDRVVQSYVERDANFGSGWTVKVKVVSTVDLNSAPEIEFQALTLSVTCDKINATFNCGVGNPMMRQFPRQRYSSGFCQRVFNDGEGCTYAADGIGGHTSCNKTLDDCKVRFPNGRSNNRGLPYLAFKGIPSNAIR